MAGRPRDVESKRRTKHLLELLAQGMEPKDAVAEARVKPERFVALLSDRQFRRAFVTLTEAKAA